MTDNQLIGTHQHISEAIEHYDVGNRAFPVASAPLVCGTVFYLTSPLIHLSLPFTVVSNPIYSLFLISVSDSFSVVQCPHSDLLFWTL